MVDNIDPLAALLLYEWILMQINQGFRIRVGFEMAVQTEEKKLKVKKGKISKGLKEEATGGLLHHPTCIFRLCWRKIKRRSLD